MRLLDFDNSNSFKDNVVEMNKNIHPLTTKRYKDIKVRYVASDLVSLCKELVVENVNDQYRNDKINDLLRQLDVIDQGLK